MPQRLRAAHKKHVGAKQTQKAIQGGTAQVVYVALDADQRITDPISSSAAEAGLEIVKVETMKELGRLCGIEVGAASAAIVTG